MPVLFQSTILVPPAASEKPMMPPMMECVVETGMEK
jgi:hypothetical protein